MSGFEPVTAWSEIVELLCRPRGTRRFQPVEEPAVDFNFIFFTQNLPAAYEKPMVKRYQYGKIWNFLWWSALLPKIKMRWQSPWGSTNIHSPHFFRTFGAFSRRVCPVTDVGWITALGSTHMLPVRPAAPVSLNRPHVVTSIEHTLNSMRWSSSAWPCVREVWPRWVKTAGAPHTFWPCSG